MTMTTRLAVAPRAALMMLALLLLVALALGAAVVGSALRPGPTDIGSRFALPPTNCASGATLASGTIATIAGTGMIAYSGDDGPALDAELHLVPQGGGDVAVDASGVVYIADPGNRVLRRVTTDGIITTLSGRATDPRPLFPLGLAIAPDGTLFLADPGDLYKPFIWRIDPDGTFTIIAGTGTPGSSGDEGPATKAQVGAAAIAVGPHGDLYIDGLNNDIRHIDPDGIIHGFAGNGQQGFSGDDGPALAASFDMGGYGGVAAGAAGDVYIGDTANHRIRKVDAAGIVTTIAGTGETGPSGDDGSVISAAIGLIGDITVDPAGDLFFLDGDTVRKIDTKGIITTIAGDGTLGSNGDCGPATSAQLNQPIGLTVANGYVYVADAGNDRIRVIAP
jgi:DNA-binding beta-propeller fold protein YncE